MKNFEKAGLIVATLLLLVGVVRAQTPATRATPCNAATPNNAVCLTWEAVTTRTDNVPTMFPITYRIEQKVGTGAFATLDTVSTLQKYVTGLAPGSYQWRIFAVENGIASAASNTGSRDVVQAPPSAPILIIAATIRAGQPPLYRIVYTVRPRDGELVFVAPESMRPAFSR